MQRLAVPFPRNIVKVGLAILIYRPCGSVAVGGFAGDDGNGGDGFR